jgi:ribonuclease D
VVHQLLGVELPKDHTRADWERRPLAPEVIEYALDDVRYLGALYHQMREQLAARGRTGWLEPEFADLTEPTRLQPEPESSWRKVKGSNRLKPKQLAILQVLAAWRERQAIASDRPKQWIVRDEVLLECARHAPGDHRALERIRGVTDQLLQRHGEAILDAIRQGHDMEPPATGKRKEKKLAPAQDAAIDLMLATVRLCGEREDISPGTLASRKDLDALLRGDHDIPLLHGWRLEAAGRTVLRTLAGELILTIKDGRAQLKEKER